MADTSEGRAKTRNAGSAWACSPGRRSLLIVSTSVAVALLAVTGLAGRAGASPAHTGHWCNPEFQFPHKEVHGTTVNHTGDPLKRVYSEKGYGSRWDAEPALEVAAGDSNRWCNEGFPAPFTTAAMKTEYAATLGDKVVIEAWIGFFGDGVRCNIVGPNRSSLTCRVTHRENYSNHNLYLTFEISRKPAA